MDYVIDHPLPFFVISFVFLCGAAGVGAVARRRDLDDAQQADYSIVVGATLTLLSLIIGFSFSMATSRYDQRKTLEEAEANAIGTEYVRAALLPAEATARVESLLKSYLGERIAFYEESDAAKVAHIDAATAALQGSLWDAVRVPALEKPTPINALVLNGMNDVLNSQGYTQAAWWNRIPRAAWALMLIIAISANALIGFNSHKYKGRAAVLLVVPILASIAFMLIADLDSPRGGFIAVLPQNLISLQESLR